MFYLSQNELTIEDSMFFYDQRTTTFINYNRLEEVSYSTKNIKIGKDLKTYPDILYHFAFMLD